MKLTKDEYTNKFEFWGLFVIVCGFMTLLGITIALVDFSVTHTLTLPLKILITLTSAFVIATIIGCVKIQRLSR